MHHVDVTAVVGTCGPARLTLARALATQTGDALWQAARIGLVPDPVDEALSLIPWLRIPGADPETDAVVEFPAAVPVEEIATRFAADDTARLRSVVCVVDAAHLLTDLGSVAYLAAPTDTGGIRYTGAAAVTVTQIEGATHVALTDTEHLDADEVGRVVALVDALAPAARVYAVGDHVGPLAEAIAHESEELLVQQQRPGWLRLLDGDAVTAGHPALTAARWEHVRPFHPARLTRLLEDRVETGEFGLLVRSAGFARLSTRPGVTAHWDHVGSLFALEPVAADGAEELLALGEDLALIGLDLDLPALTRALDGATLTDQELLAGPEAWAGHEDPFPAWALTAPD